MTDRKTDAARERRDKLTDLLIKFYFSIVKILGQKLTDISVPATVLLLKKACRKRETETRRKRESVYHFVFSRSRDSKTTTLLADLTASAMASLLKLLGMKSRSPKTHESSFASIVSRICCARLKSLSP